MQFPPKKADLIIKEISENFHLFKCFQKKPAQLVAHTKMVPGINPDTILLFILLSLTAVSRIPM